MRAVFAALHFACVPVIREFIKNMLSVKHSLRFVCVRCIHFEHSTL